MLSLCYSNYMDLEIKPDRNIAADTDTLYAYCIFDVQPQSR